MTRHFELPIIRRTRIVPSEAEESGCFVIPSEAEESGCFVIPSEAEESGFSKTRFLDYVRRLTALEMTG